MSKKYVPTRTYTGRIIDLVNFTENDIDLTDIAISLSRQNRYAGHSAIPWSVGQHSLLCGAMAQAAGCSEKDIRVVFLHDVEETWVQDVIFPIKKNYMLGRYKEISNNITETVHKFFGTYDHWNNPDTKHVIDCFDRAAYIIEGFYLLPGFIHDENLFHNDVNALVHLLIQETDFEIPDWLLNRNQDEVAQDIFEILNVYHGEKVLQGEISSDMKVIDNVE